LKQKVISFLSYIFITVFVSFVMFLVKPLFPSFSSWLDSLSTRIKSSLNLALSVQLISLITALIFLLFVYILFVVIFNYRQKERLAEFKVINIYERYKNPVFTTMKTVLIILFIPLIYAYGRALFGLIQRFDITSNRVFFFSLGFIVFTVFWLLILRKYSFFSTFEHEFTHMVLALLFFRRPRAFYVHEKEGGWIMLAGGNFIITLGPYFFLTLCLFILPIYLVIQPQFYPYFLLLMGALLAYHTFSTLRETDFNRQTDIIFNGKIFSAFVILLGNLISYGYILAFVYGGFEEGRAFFKGGWNELIMLYQAIVH